MATPGFLTQVSMDTPCGLWVLNDALSSTAVLDSNPAMFNPNNPGAVTGTVTFARPGLISAGINAALFDGSTGRIDIVPSTWNPGANNPFSIECLIKPAVVDAAFRRIGGREPVGNHGVMLAWHNTLNYYVGRGDASAGIDTPSGGTPTVGVAVHLIGTYDGTTLKMYVNNVVGGSGSIASSRIADVQAANLRIGGTVAGGTNGNATVAAFAVYNYALTPIQVAAHYNAWQTPSPELYIPFPGLAQPWDIAGFGSIDAWYTETFAGVGNGKLPAIGQDVLVGVGLNGSPVIKYWTPVAGLNLSA